MPKTPNEIIGVFAHETGHLAGGHLSRLREQLASAQTASIIALLAGVGAMVAGARAGASGGGNAGAAAFMAHLITGRCDLYRHAGGCGFRNEASRIFKRSRCGRIRYRWFRQFQAEGQCVQGLIG